MTAARLDRAPARAPATAARVAPAVATRRMRLRWLLAPLGVLAVVGAHLALAWPMRVPTIHPDELGYLLNARVLARGGLRSPVEYYPGFSVLLAPLWLGAVSPVRVFREALVVQAGLSGVLAILVWVLVGRMSPGVQGWRRVLVAAAVCAYPSYLLYGDVAMSELAFAAGFVGVVLMLGRAGMVEASGAAGGSDLAVGVARRPGRWAALGLAAGLLVSVHPRGLAVVVAVALIALLVLGVRRAVWPSLTALVAGTVLGLAITEWLLRIVRTPATQLGAYQPGGVLSKNLSAHGLWSLVVELAGQLFYLSVATAGLVPLGIGLGAVALWRMRRGDRDVATLLQGFAALGFVGVWALSSLFMNLGDRADKLVYGRYDEGAIAPLLVVGLAWLVTEQGVGRWWRWLVVGAAVIAGTGGLVLAGDSKQALYGAVNPVNVIGLQPLLTRMGEHIHVLALVGCGVGAVIALGVLAARRPVLAVAALVVLFAASAIDTETSYLVPGSRARARQSAIVQAVAAIRADGLGPDDCVSYDPAPLGYGDYNFYEDQFLLPQQRFAPYLSTGAVPPCGTLVVSRSPDFPALHPGSREVTAEQFTVQALWAVPGRPLFDVLAARGWLSPPGGTASAPLPPAALAGGQLVVPGGPQLVVRPGPPTPVPVAVVHGPDGAPWPAVAALHSGSGQFGVRLIVESDAPAGFLTGGRATPCHGSFVSCQVMDLPQTLLPGQTVVLALTVHPSAPGRFTVALGLVQEGVAAFSAHAELTVVVAPA